MNTLFLFLGKVLFITYILYVYCNILKNMGTYNDN